MDSCHVTDVIVLLHFLCLKVLKVYQYVKCKTWVLESRLYPLDKSLTGIITLVFYLLFLGFRAYVTKTVLNKEYFIKTKKLTNTKTI